MRAGSICLVIVLAIASTAIAGDDEGARRGFFDSDDRAHKFQTPHEIFPSRKLRASPTPLSLPPADLPDDFEIRYEWQGHMYGVEDFNERTRSNALLILKDGRIVTEIYRNGSTPTTRLMSFSIAKSITSTIVGLAIEDGYIGGVDEPLTKR